MPPRRLWPTLACAWLWSLAAVFPATNAGWSGCWQLLLLPSGLTVGIGWVRRSARCPGVFRDWRTIGPWLSVPTVGLVLVVLSVTNLGLVFRVRLCEDELRAFAEAARAGKEDVGAYGPHDCRVGLFYVHRTVGFGSDVNMVTARSLGESYGVTYWPEATPDQMGGGYQHLYGPWYRYYDDW